MNNNIKSLKAILVISLGWGILWTVAWTSIALVFRMIDPGSFGPGESPFVIGPFLGFMGALSGGGFWLFLLLFERSKSLFEMSPFRAVLWGILGSAFIQAGYLGHGDVGIMENIKQALLFAAFGGGAGLVWFMIARRWPVWRSFS